MPKRKTSTQPKRKIKKPVKIERPVYPDYIENFIKEVESKTPCIVKVDQYSENNAYHVGVLIKQGKGHRCIWMVSFAELSEHLNVFWSSMAYQSLGKA